MNCLTKNVGEIVLKTSHGRPCTVDLCSDLRSSYFETGSGRAQQGASFSSQQKLTLEAITEVLEEVADLRHRA